MLDVSFYGVRGSTPCSCEETRGFGGNTSCVLVQVPDKDPIVLDCGTGLRYLGQDLLEASDGTPFQGTALVTHLHWDHMMGLPFFVPLLADGARLKLIGPPQDDSSLAEAIGTLVCPPLFPVNLDQLPGEVEFVERSTGCFEVDGITISVASVQHVGNTNGYRIEYEGGSVAYISDHQQPIGGSMAVADSVLALCKDVDLLIHDAQYDEVEFEAKATWGHSTPEYAAEVARRSGAKRLVLFHHDPLHDDAWVEAAVVRTQQNLGDACEVIAAREGMTLRSGS